jgi:cardiolipin synthase A/B
LHHGLVSSIVSEMDDRDGPDENRVELLVDGHRILPALLRDLEAARRVVHVSVFLFFHDPIGDQVAGALIAAVRRGVVARVLLNVQKTRMGDPFSTGEKEMMKHDPNVHHDATDVRPLCRRMREGGVQVLDTNIDYDRIIPCPDQRITSIAAQIRDTIAVDDLHIDHRKVIVVDGRVAYCGGANIGAQYLFHTPFDPHKEAHAEGAELKAQGHPEPWWKWHDSLTRFEGPVVRALDGHFRDRWILDGGEEFPEDEGRAGANVPASSPSIRGRPMHRAEVLVNEPNNRPNQIRETYLRLIRQAERSIFIENPYTYHPAIVAALLEAKQRRPELRVDMVLPARRWNDNEFAQDAQQYHYRRALACGIAVHEYQCHFTHLKMAVFDERFSIHGSTNLNYRSLEDDKDFEMVVLVDDEELARTVLREVRDVDIPRARRFTRQEVERTLTGWLRIQTRDPRTLFLLARRVL